MSKTTALVDRWAVLPALPASFYVLIVTAVLLVFRHRSAFLQPPVPGNAPRPWKAYNWPLLGSAMHFYGRRRDMLEEGRDIVSNGNFSFFVGRKHIINLGGLNGRKTFYESKGLNFAEGFVELLAGMPSASEGQEDNWARYFNKVLFTLTRTENLTKNLAVMAADARGFCEELGKKSSSKASSEWQVMNPFENIYELVYKLTMRIVGATEIAENRKMLKKTLSIFEKFESNNSTARIIFPWLTTPAYVVRLILGALLYMHFARLVNKRKQSGRREEDAVQYLLDQGADNELIIKFETSALWAGLLNTGINASWMPIFLAHSEAWKAIARAEVDSVISRHRKSTEQSAADVLDTLTLEEWENEFPVIDICLRESIRIVVPGCMFRKNTSGSDIPIGDTGEVIPHGSFASYLLDNMHMNPEVYPDPLKYEPGRHLDASAQGKKEPHLFLGWGTGRHPCMGMRFAKLEMALINAYFLASFDFEPSDSSGNLDTTPPPPVNRNAHTVQKSKEAVYIRYKARGSA